MSDEQPTSGTSTNPAAEAHAPRQATPVMDVVPPPAAANTPVEPPVATAPAELPEIPQISDEIADQIAADATTPPAPTSAPTSEPSTDTLAVATAPPEEDAAAPAHAPGGDSPSDLIQAEINRDEADPATAPAKVPKARNPAQTAIIITIILMVLLAGLAVFAYMSTQN